MTQLLFFTLVPVIAAIAGAGFASMKEPDKRFMSLIHHFTAGVIFSAVAIEVLPSLKNQPPVAVICGGIFGMIVMLTMQYIDESGRHKFVFLYVVGMDIFIDGFILGLGYADGLKTGYVLTLALTIETLFLGLSVVPDIKQVTGRLSGKMFFVTGLALLLPLGSLPGYAVSSFDKFWFVFSFAFGLAALLYLVTEELLVKAHEEKGHSRYGTIFFFFGFMVLMLLEEGL
ncbi:transporter [Pantoea ananatis]|uniref:ZIP family metal transporter n=1 Tax=Pantoea ananas TaxID=553 RepID=UPI0024ADFFF5|nr:transporter [Pantoea ananatis]MDI6539866.1 transporter [Pantoea ananatis]